MFRQYRSISLLALAATVLMPFTAFAQDDGGPTGLTSAMSGEFGEHLITNDGYAVYLYVEDDVNESTCVDGCTNNWHPVLAGDIDVTVDGDVNAELVSTLERADGSIQVSYAGHPLYTSRHDREPGATRGQLVGRDSFHLVSLTGDAITEAVEQEAVVLEDEALAQMMTDGAETYRMHCVACHGAEAQGGVGPKLAANPFVGNAGSMVEQILSGFPSHGMPAFRDVLNDYQIASLLTFIRGSFDNEYGVVLEEEVEQRR